MSFYIGEDWTSQLPWSLQQVSTGQKMSTPLTQSLSMSGKGSQCVIRSTIHTLTLKVDDGDGERVTSRGRTSQGLNTYGLSRTWTLTHWFSPTAQYLPVLFISSNGSNLVERSPPRLV